MNENKPDTHLGEQLAREQESFLAARAAIAKYRTPIQLEGIERIKQGFSVALGAKLGVTMYAGTVDEVTISVRRRKNKVARKQRKVNRRRSK